MLDRGDRGETRRRGTDLVRVQQTRAVSKLGRDIGRKQAPAIYLSELGPRRVVTQLKWFISTIIVAISGLAIIGVVIYTSMNVGEGNAGRGMFGAFQRAGIDAMRPRAASLVGAEKPIAIGLKTDRLVLSSKGLTTRNLIYEQVVQRRGTGEYLSTKPYVKLVATLATEKPDEDIDIPAFNPATLYENNTPIARKDQSGGELSTDPRVSVRFIDVPGGFLPREDHVELSDDEIERLVAETDAVYTESEVGLEGAAPQDTKRLAGTDMAFAAPEPHTTVLVKRMEEEESTDEGYDRRSIIAKGYESLDSVIRGVGVDPMQAGLVSTAVAAITKSRKLRAGEEVRLGLTPSASEEGGVDVGKITVVYQGTNVTIVRDGEGGYAPSEKHLKPEHKADDTVGDRATVYLSAYRAAQSQEIPYDFLMKFVKVHSYDVDFKQRVKSGDGFELFYDLVQDENGVERPGELFYAAVTIGGETHGYYRFRSNEGVDYFDDRGSNSKKFLMRTPIRGARLTSGFGWRKHPLLHTLRLHSGVDWAGPIGTPIYAAGNGVIETAERNGNYGNYVRIRHANGYKTAYAHMLRFAQGVATGVKVRQGQVIGYLGNTGMSTGPHLHYEVLINNRFTNPLSIKIPKARQLQGRLLADFRKERARIDDLMRRPPVKTRVATVER
ncbi:M23 family metallopeptidase [Rhodomicrobium udaipurense]|uniref:M23 family metallopeptidase n=1 Tax=Rhodomicrobium udaipurense TaxID=1202716 RepID=A0A8I1KHB5_9HYPH|nr:M23 family metallopeptidase [Rhodomicrobium udaipurense]MBJ7543550.1 M23 family metallopeptidase [Rhodomicrobium udaipurense]